MPRGGYRNGSGGIPTWKHGKTKTIRVPIDLADEIIKIARAMDDGEEFVSRRKLPFEPVTGSKGTKSSSSDSVTLSKVVDLTGISIRQVNGIISIYLEDLVKAGYQLFPESLSLMVEARIRRKLEQ